MENTQEGKATPGGPSTDQVRDELFRILDEVVTARSDRAADLRKRFRTLWDEVCREEGPTVH